MTDWTPQDDWSQVKVGDPVRVMRAEQMLTGKVAHQFSVNGLTEPYELALKVDGVAGTIKIGRAYWQLSVPAKPAVVLPTEAGAYLDTKGEAWSLCRAGGWFSHGDGSLTVEYADEEVESVWCRYGPFTKLEPVAVTAKKVLDFVAPGLTCDSYDTARKEFGVTDG